MNITGTIWLEQIIDKIETKHGVSPEEVEEVLDSHPKIRKMNKGRVRGEDVYRALGQTYGRRYMTVFFIYKRTHEALIISARDMDSKERRSYGKK